MESIAAAGPPAQVIVATDEMHDLPHWVTQVLVPAGSHMADFFNACYAVADTTWVWGIGVDDLFLPGAFDPIPSEADCYIVPSQMEDGSLFQYVGGFDKMYLTTTDLMYGAFFHRTALLREMPMRRMPFIDWAHFSEMSYFGKTVEWGSQPRSIWVRHPDAHCHEAPHEWHEQHWAFNERLAAGLIQMGQPEQYDPHTEMMQALA